MGIRRRLSKILGWGIVLTLAIVTGGVTAAYFCVTDSATLADHIRREAPKFLPGCLVETTRVKLRPLWGDLTLQSVLVRSPGSGEALGASLASAHRVVVRFDPWAMLKGRFELRDVTLLQPKLKLRRRDDGSWNVQGLLADPWPLQKGGPTPPIEVREGTIELAEGAKDSMTLLRDVTVKVAASTGLDGPIPFEMTAKGGTGLFDRVGVRGTIDPSTGHLILKDGELVRLTLSEAYRDRLPVEVSGWLASAGLAGGEVDLDLPALDFDPLANPRLHYHASARLRRGLWKCKKLPFSISDVSVNAEARDGEIAILDAHGNDGKTALSLTGVARLDQADPKRSTFRVVAGADNLELDRRLRDWLPEGPHREIWDAYFPNVAASSTSAGRVSASVAVTRAQPGAEPEFVADVRCLDVSMKYKHFAYPVDHITGTIHATKKRMDLAVRTMVNDRPVKVTGTVKNPGPDAIADLTFEIESLPLNAALFNALPPEVKPKVASFQPTGTIGGKATLHRDPPLTKKDDPRGRVEFHAWIDLNPGCSVTWEGLKYPVRDLVGHLEIHPDWWIFRDMQGKNGQAAITVTGEVRQLNTSKPQVGADALKVHVELKARNLPFDQQLRDALPTPWKVTWGTLNPSGASDIDATIDVDPLKPLATRDHDRIVIVPLAATGVKLRFNPLVGPGAPTVPSQIELRMDDVGGTFVYDTADTPHTSMTDVHFTFQRAPVNFASGKVDVRDTGQFQLDVDDIQVENLRLDEDLRRYMPPVMANFSRRLDDLKIANIKADLGLGWSGKLGESAWCRWNEALVILDNNKISIGSDFGLEHIQGELNHVAGSFNGRDFQVKGLIDLESVTLFGQQVTALTSDLEVEGGFARLERIKGKVLGGELNGHVRASLEASPSYSMLMEVKQADLQEYARTQPGHQEFKGRLNARVDLAGLGYDPHTITGDGSARIVHGDLGTLPAALRFVNVLKSASLSRREAKTAFDTAEVSFRVRNGETTLDPVRLVGNTITLEGNGTLDVRGQIDLKLRILPLRDAVQIPLISDLTRGLSGQILRVHVLGPVAAPDIKPEPIPLPGDVGRALKHRNEVKQSGLVGPWRTGLESRLKAGLAGRWFGGER
jgi:hypothetical protein